ncbi:uncharacterized protein LOC127748476 [Arachis duranensis]|uniref:Uncharacterized protein LOC127748476 n=1 Tax=Arachis duranensis TaxID=130453 RepID=A0A9C6WRD4_ARADU|nr:uncharacterized protein LOC127748476 [Arachis duranensis]
MNNQGSGHSEVYGDTYNPSWKNHPNLRWGDSHTQNQQTWQKNSNQNNSRNTAYTNHNNQQTTNHNSYRKPQNNYPHSSYYPPNNPTTNQNIYHPPSAPHNQPHPSQDAQRISNLESLIKKMLKHQEITSKNHEASIRNLERQIGQLSKQAVIERPSSSLPSDTIPNPKEECKAIQMRSGKILVKDEGATKKPKENDKKQAEKEEASKEVTAGKQAQEKEDQPQILRKGKEAMEEPTKEQRQGVNFTPPLPYPQRFNKETKDQHFPKFLEVFKKL